MPGYQQYDHAAFELKIDGDLEENNSVYFTDQSPTFGVCVRNKFEQPIEVEIDIGHRYVSAENARESDERFCLQIPPKETARKEYEPGSLVYQDSGAVGWIGAGFNPDVDWDEEGQAIVERMSGPREFHPLHTYMIYDRDYYRVNYLRPRYAQYIAAVLSVLIVLVGIIQIMIVI